MPLRGDAFTALIVEPEYLIAAAIEDILTQEGFRVVVAQSDVELGPYLNRALIDVAVVDFTVHGAGDVSLAWKLMSIGVPVVFCTAFDLEAVTSAFPGAPVVRKPFMDLDLLAAVETAFAVNRPIAEQAGGPTH